MKEEILLPLGMKNSSYSWSKEWKPEVPNGYDVNGKAVPVYTYSMKASENLYSTVEDIAKFVIAGMNSSFINHEVLSSESIEKMYQPTVEDIPGYYGIVFDSYGFGHYLEWFSNGNNYFFCINCCQSGVSTFIFNISYSCSLVFLFTAEYRNSSLISVIISQT